MNVICNVTSDDINYLGDLIRTNTGIILTPDSAENDRLEKMIVRNLLNLIENQSV